MRRISNMFVDSSDATRALFDGLPAANEVFGKMLAPT
jgi:hypothetical protein